MSRPLLSIVVPSFNSEKYIGECLLSLEREKNEQVEYILIDGGSTDRTLELVQPYRKMFTTIVSEPDSGQSDAFNKGFSQASGTYFTWLNSDDVLCPGSLNRALALIAAEPVQWYAANVVYINSESEIIRCCRSGAFEAFALNFGILNVFGPSTIFHRELFEQFGQFREDFHYCMDTEYWWRIASESIQYKRLPLYLWALRLHDEAKTAASVGGGLDARPPRMQVENNLNRVMYFSKVSEVKRMLGVFLVRVYRIFNLSYPKAYFSTFAYRGKIIEQVGRIY